MIQVADIAKARGAEAVESITIEVGPLCGTEPALLLNAFLVMRSGPASTAKLLIECCPVRICCLECGFKSETAPNRLICGHCGGWRTQVIAGDELRLLSVEIRMPESMGRRDHSRNAEQIFHV